MNNGYTKDVLDEIDGLTADKQKASNEIAAYQKNFAEAIREGLGEDMKATLNDVAVMPPVSGVAKPSKTDSFFSKLLKVLGV